MAAVKTLCCVYVLITSALSVDSHKRPHGLLCTSDLVETVTCTWDNSSLGPEADCWISGTKRFLNFNYKPKRPELMIRSCKLKRHRNSLPGCSLVFEGKTFFASEVMPDISLNCNGTLVEKLQDYKPVEHIKMNPPGAPSINSSANDTWVSWSPGRPLAEILKSLNYQVQLKQTQQTWREANTLTTQEPPLRIPESALKGSMEVRVRVKPADPPKSHWSSWSPTTSWRTGRDDPSGHQEPGLDQMSQLMVVLTLSLSLFIFVVLVLYRNCRTRGLLKGKPVPSPSEYFHLVHGGNLKTWLNPLSESFFTAQPREQISPVEVCDVWDVDPSTSPSSSSTNALLHFQTFPSIRTFDSSSSSSCFSNMGYFMSNSSSGSAPVDISLAYFTYQDDIHHLHHPPSSPGPSLGPYESLKTEPQSPDSGFGLGQEDKSDEDDQSSPLVFLPLHLLSEMCPPSTPPHAADPPHAAHPPHAAPPPHAAHPPHPADLPHPPHPPHPPSVSQVSPDGQQVDGPVTAVVIRASSMPVNPCQSDYLTLKELQATFSNKSI